jgi:glycosyltransferase involved in cell wall biosynthesis
VKIGFDAKRAFANKSGLGNYSRFILDSLSKFYPEHSYFLFTPYIKENIYSVGESQNSHTILPHKLRDRAFKAFWRSKSVIKDISSLNIDIFHGLSGEIPYGIEKTSVKPIVTIHDLIFLRYPELYKSADRKIYKAKFKNACKHSERIVAISEQTKSDIVNYLEIPENKIEVIYQGCHARYFQKSNHSELNRVTKKFRLPSEYILYVGTIEERKNLLTIVKAIHRGKLNIPLVVVGRETAYAKQVKAYIHKHKLTDIYFLKDVNDVDLPSLYQMAKVFVYPSVFEGFGIPVLEALYSRTPVITTQGGCFSEAGGDSSIYVNPNNYEEIAFSILKLLEDENHHQKVVDAGFKHAQRFNHEKLASNLMNLYNTI